LKTNQNHPLYTIGVVAEMLGIHPETIRVWETSGTAPAPQRRSGKRFYSENDLKRLRFIRRLAGEGLPQRAVIYYLRLYPCWKTADCPGCTHSARQSGGTKPCWQEEDTYCQVADLVDPCSTCALRPVVEPVPEIIAAGDATAVKLLRYS
jgi:MerR family transcriptional regulator, heat shock protein HspR